jgi:hypothetical protein
VSYNLHFAAPLGFKSFCISLVGEEDTDALAFVAHGAIPCENVKDYHVPRVPHETLQSVNVLPGAFPARIGLLPQL